MRTTNNNRKSRFLAFLLSVMMVSSAGAIFASCKDGGEDSSSSSSSTSEETGATTKDEGEIKNASFNFTKPTKSTVISTSVTGWSAAAYSNASGSADSNKADCGVINTADWEYWTTANFKQEDLEKMTEAEAIEKWDDFNVQDKLAYYGAMQVWDDEGDLAPMLDFLRAEAVKTWT